MGKDLRNRTVEPIPSRGHTSSIAVACKYDASSAAMFNGARKDRSSKGKYSAKTSTSSSPAQQAKPAEPEHRAEFDVEEDDEIALQAQLLHRSGMDVENMTAEFAELDNLQQPSPDTRKSANARSPIQPRQTLKNKGKGKAQDDSEPRNTSSQKRKRNGEDIFSMSSDDEAGAQGNARPKPSKKASKRPKTKGALKSRSIPIPDITLAKKPRGRPPEKVVYEQPNFEYESATPENNQPEGGVEESNSEFIRRKVPKRVQQIGGDDDQGTVENHSEHGGADGGGAVDQDEVDNFNDILDPPSPSQPRPPASREQHRESARNARKVSSNHANGIHRDRIGHSQAGPKHRREVAVEGGEEPGEAANDIPQVPEAEVNGDTGEEDDQVLFQKLTLWNGIIDLNFFPKIKRISEHLGCTENGGAWVTVTSEDRGVRSRLGKEMDVSLNKLRSHYQSLKRATDEENEVNKTKAFSEIDQTTDELKKMVGFDGNVPEDHQISRRTFLRDLYIVLVRKFLRILKAAVLAYGEFDPLTDEEVKSVIKLTKVILKLFESLDKQKKELEPKDCGQTKQPLKEIRPLLRDKLLKNCERELSKREETREREESRARTQQRQYDREAVYKREEAQRKINERKAREYNEGLRARSMNDPEKSRLIKAEMKRIAYQKLSQEEKVRAILDRNVTHRIIRPRAQSTRESEVHTARAHRSPNAVGDSDLDDPFSDRYQVPQQVPHQVPQRGTFSQLQRNSNDAPVQPRSPSPPPFPEPEFEAEPEPASELESESELEPEPEPVKFGDLSDEEKQNFYDHFREKYRYEQQGLVDEYFWHRLQRNLDGGRYTLDEIFGLAEELQVALDNDHEEGRFLAAEYLWTFHVWEPEDE